MKTKRFLFRSKNRQSASNRVYRYVVFITMHVVYRFLLYLLATSSCRCRRFKIRPTEATKKKTKMKEEEVEVDEGKNEEERRERMTAHSK